jgi:cell division septal protein FtsQ
MARVTLPESRVRRYRRQRRYIIAGIVALVVIGIIGGLALLSDAPFLQVTTIEVSGTETLATSTVTDFVTQKLQGSYFYLFSKDNIFLYPKSQLIASLPVALPTIASVDVHAKNFNTMTVVIVERQPKALWCGTNPVTPEPCFLLDQDGTSYAAAANFSGDAYQKYYGTLDGKRTPKQYLTPDQFKSLSALIDALAQNQSGNSISGIAVDANQDVTVAFADGFNLLFALSSDGADVYSRFALALQSDPFKGKSLSTFSYLDLRFGDKLYYKLK